MVVSLYTTLRQTSEVVGTLRVADGQRGQVHEDTFLEAGPPPPPGTAQDAPGVDAPNRKRVVVAFRPDAPETGLSDGRPGRLVTPLA